VGPASRRSPPASAKWVVFMQPAVVVTGASSGLGVEFAKLAAAEGTKVVLIARSRPQLEALAANLDPTGRFTVVLDLDLSARDAGLAVADKLKALDLYCHILVNNAGFGLFGYAVELDRERQLGIIDVNVRAATDLMLQFLPAMVARGSGAVLNVGSVAGFAPGPRMALYFASKAYLISVSQALMQEVRQAGVTVTCLCPGPLRTPFLGRAGADGVASFKLLRKLETADVARAGWEAMKAGRALCVPGFGTKIAVTLTRIMPLPLTLALASRLQRVRRRAS
jgi:short-subunit dehydrogenase